MKKYKYLIIGGGLAGDAAVRGIRELDKDGSVAMISMESDPPYVRPALSKGLWKGKPIEKIWRNTEAAGAELHLGRRITHLDVQAKQATDDQGTRYGFEKLLLATGGSPIHLPSGGDIIYFRDLQDYHRLRQLSETGRDFAVIGGGFIGSEIAAALQMAGRHVTMIFLEKSIGQKLYPADLSAHLNEYYREKGVELLTEDAVESVSRQGNRQIVKTRNGRSLEIDGVVAGIGIRPNTELATQAGLPAENGIVVDEKLMTSLPDVYAAGDVANFMHAALGTRTRVEHEDNAIRMGHLAGRNMAGAREVYTHTPMFYADLFDLGYEAVGKLDSRLETVADWQEPLKKGIVYYLENGRVRGVLLWDVWKQVDHARRLIAQAGPFTASDLLGHPDQVFRGRDRAQTSGR